MLPGTSIRITRSFRDSTDFITTGEDVIEVSESWELGYEYVCEREREKERERDNGGDLQVTPHYHDVDARPWPSVSDNIRELHCTAKTSHSLLDDSAKLIESTTSISLHSTFSSRLISEKFKKCIFLKVSYSTVWLWNMVLYVKGGGMKAEITWEQVPKANIWTQNEWEGFNQKSL